jgi:hypothetical protein
MPLPAFGDRLGSDALVVTRESRRSPRFSRAALISAPVRVSAALELRDGARRAPGSDLLAQQREDEHRHRQREQVLAGLERVEAQHDPQVHSADEELALEDELLPHQRRGPVRSCAARSSGVRLGW